MTERAIQDTYELERLAADAEVGDVIDESAELIDQATSDAVYRYFRDVGGHRLLSHEEEIDLSRKVRAGPIDSLGACAWPPELWGRR